MYRWLRHGLFALDPESAHDVAMQSLSAAHRLGLLSTWWQKPQSCPIECLGLRFENPVGLAAGLDKNADHLDALGALGFGHIEVGTVTPKPQSGNQRPRMFRLTSHHAIINRLGFNNKGVDHLVVQLKKRRFGGIVGANVGKQKETPIDQAAQDYRFCIERVFAHCDYITINVSSPNTENLRQLQDQGHLKELLQELVSLRDHLTTAHGKHTPLLIKIAPDWVPSGLELALETIGDSGIDGLIATNTTVDHTSVANHRHAEEAGGLSGKPLLSPANRVLKTARQVLGDHFPIIGVGGILCGDDALSKARQGANLVQVYTGLVYRGPTLIRECVQAWPSH